MLDELFMQVLDLTRVGSYVILVVSAARLLLKKAPRIFSYVLWLAVLFRLLSPVIPQVPISLVPKVPPVSEQYALANESISLAGAGEAAYRAIGDAVNGGLGIQHIRTTEPEENGMTRYVTTDWWDVWILFGQYVWIAGLIIMAAYGVLSYGKLKRQLAVKVRLRDNIYIADDIQTPFVMGIFQPVICLPPGLTDSEQGYIICHEQHHIKRGDPVFKALAFLALCIHWFNPLVWAAFILANKDMEMSCDEAVIRKLGQEIRSDYAACLLSLTVGRSSVRIPIAFGEGDTKSRIRNLAGFRKPTVWVLVVSVILCGILAVCLMGNPVTSDSEAAETEKEGTEIWWKQSDAEETVEMKPAMAKLTGAFDSYLYVPLEGQTYRYERSEVSVEDVTRTELLYCFTESADPLDVEWEVYGLQEYEDHRAVLVVAGNDYQCIYQYSPSKRCPEGALEQAIQKGRVVHLDGDVAYGQEIWEAFAETASRGEAASVQLAMYYALDPKTCSEEYYEAYREDYPALHLYDLTYDGNNYSLRWMNGSTEYIRTYEYLMHYTGDAPTLHATFDTYTMYVLTHDNQVTWEEIQRGMFSSRLGDYIDHHTVYQDLK